jgi:iron-sulfur cluster repair protein YtfE (RIC family)
MAGLNFYDKWAEAKKNFETATNSKKPSKTFLKVRQKTKIASTFKKYQKDRLERGISADKALAVTEKMAKDASSKIEDYLELLAETLADEGKSEDYKKEVDVLKAELEYIAEAIKSTVTQAERGAKGWNLVTYIIRNHESTMRTALKKYMAAAKKVKANPRVVTWNSIMAIQDSPMRAITTAMDGFSILKKSLSKVPDEFYVEGSEFYKVFEKMQQLIDLADDLVKEKQIQIYATNGQSLVMDINDFDSKEAEKETVLEALEQINAYTRLFRDNIFIPFNIVEDDL